MNVFETSVSDYASSVWFSFRFKLPARSAWRRNNLLPEQLNCKDFFSKFSETVDQFFVPIGHLSSVGISQMLKWISALPKMTETWLINSFKKSPLQIKTIIVSIVLFSFCVVFYPYPANWAWLRNTMVRHLVRIDVTRLANISSCC